MIVLVMVTTAAVWGAYWMIANIWVANNYFVVEHLMFTAINEIRRTHGLAPVSCAHHRVDSYTTGSFSCNLWQIRHYDVLAAYSTIILDPTVRRISVDLDVTAIGFVFTNTCRVILGASR